MKIVIFCGGFGTRMWPASRKSYPKQFFPIVKGKSFFQTTVSRFKTGFKPEDIIVSTEERYVDLVRKQAPEIPAENIIGEPERRDNLGAVGLVSALVEKRFPSEVMFFSWSDHFIGNQKKFMKVVKAAAEYTKETGRPVSVNEKPTFASVHNGWIEQGRLETKNNGFPFYQIERFIEKPNFKTAKKFLKANHKYFIHTGYGAWRSDMMLSYFKDVRPKEYKGLLKIMDAWGTKSYRSVLKKEYHKFEKVSIDIGLFEKLPADLRLNIPMSVGWEDAGTWQLFYDAMLEKGEDTVVEGESYILQQNAFKNLVVGQKGKVISIVGLKNIAVIDTKDALLVCDLDSTQDVKEVFKKLEKDKPEYVE
jgi:mannose-1-phosphate guanylyltransferase